MSVEISSTEPAQRGNVLFLILIAVVLFAALSYAVTKSTRSGDGNASKETTALEATWLQNYGNTLASAITRMRVSQNIATTDLCFIAPANSLYSNTAYQTRNVFHPKGGNALFEALPKTLVGEYAPDDILIGIADLPNVGTSGSLAGADVVMVVGVKKSVCDAVNKRINTPLYDGIPGNSLDTMSSIYPGACITSIPYPGAMTPAAYPGLSGSHEGCIVDPFDPDYPIYYYYRVLVER